MTSVPRSGARLLLALAIAILTVGLVPNRPLGEGPHPTCAQAAAAGHVAIVVEHGGGGIRTACVSFTGGQVTAEAAMNLSGIPYETVDYGGGLGKAVCRIDFEPASYPPGCFTASSPYWAMFVSHGGGAWTVARLGISSQPLADGDALGWHYVPPGGGSPPPAPAGVCVVPASPPPPPSVAPAPTFSPLPSPAVTPLSPDSAPAQASPPPTSGPPLVEATSTPSAAASAPPAPPAGSALTPPPPADGRVPGPDLGWLLVAAGIGALVGLLALRLLADRRRR